MSKKFLLSLTFFSLFIFLTNTSQASTLQNGGFEEGYTGWNWTTAFGATIVEDSGGGVLGSDHYLNITSPGLLSQGNIETIDGQLYQVTFYTKQTSGISDVISFVVGQSMAVPFQVDTNYWEKQAFTFLGTGFMTSLYIIGAGASGASSVDQFSISAVPIPAAAWLLGTGILGLVAIRRSRKA